MISLRDTLTSSGDCETLKRLVQPDLSKQLHEADLTFDQLTPLAANNRNAEIIGYCISLGANLYGFKVLTAVIESMSLEIHKIVIPAGYKLDYDHISLISTIAANYPLSGWNSST